MVSTHLSWLFQINPDTNEDIAIVKWLPGLLIRGSTATSKYAHLP